MEMKLPVLLENESVKKRFNEVLNQNAGAFIQSLLTIYNGNEQLQKCDARSILAAAGFAATLNLSIAPNLGYAYIVPYNGKAQFQLGWKGIVQLAHRTGKYTAINSAAVREGEIRGVDCVTGELIKGERLSEEVVGYVAYMRLVNGFEKALYMTRAEVEEHALTYSQTYKADKNKNWSIWAKQFNQMACKTVLKMLLSRWGVLSADMATALQSDQATITKSTFTYVDNDGRTVERENYSDLDSQIEGAEMAEVQAYNAGLTEA